MMPEVSGIAMLTLGRFWTTSRPVDVGLLISIYWRPTDWTAYGAVSTRIIPPPELRALLEPRTPTLSSLDAIMEVLRERGFVGVPGAAR